jgi:hypothetical protein
MNMPHGLLNMSVPQGMPEAYKFEDINIDILKRNFN